MEYAKEFIKPSFIHESLINGYLWSNPSLYQKYKSHKVTKDTFTESVWYFYYMLGLEMYDNGIRDFDDKTVYTFVVSRPKEVGKKSYIDAYNGFGGYETINELIEACKSDAQNDEYHFSEIQKYESLRRIQKDGLINVEDKELITKLCKANLKQVKLYIETKYKEAFSHINSGEVVEHDLSANLDRIIAKMNEGDVMGTPLHNSPRLNKMIKGWKNGALYYLVLSSGVGKSSIAMEKFVLSLYENDEKAMIAINEESVDKWQQLLLATVSNNILKSSLNRERMFAGSFDTAIMEKLENAKQWIEEKGKNELIKVLELKKYRMEDILSRVELYRPKGYTKLIIDTFKPDRSTSDMARWEAFSNNAQELNDLIKEDNYNVGTLATVQLKLGKETRYLDLDAIGKSMEIVEVASVVMMGRLIFADEYKDGKYALKPYNYKKDELTGKWYKEEYGLDDNKQYLILWISKNRFGSEDEQIVYEVNYDFNSFKEVAFVRVPRYGN